MPAARFYANAPSTTIPSGCTDSATTVVVGSITGLPVTYPYKLIFSPETGSEEVVSVTGGTGTSLNVVRGRDSTAGVAHSAGAVVIHGVSAEEFTELAEHLVDTSAHGVAVAVAGTTDAQTFTNKTVALGSNTVSGTKAQFNTAMTDADFATLTGTETLTNKTVTGPSATMADIVQGARVFAIGTSPSNIASIFRGAALQSADLAQWQNSAGAVLASVDEDGDLSAQDIDAAGDLTVTGTINGGAVPFAMAAGVVDVTVSAAISGTAAVVYPVDRFSVAPIIQVTVMDTDASNYFTGVTANADTGCTVKVVNYKDFSTSLTVRVHWVATQMASGSASG